MQLEVRPPGALLARARPLGLQVAADRERDGPERQREGQRGAEDEPEPRVAVAAVAAAAEVAAAVARLFCPVPLADIRNALWFGGGALFLTSSTCMSL